MIEKRKSPRRVLIIDNAPHMTESPQEFLEAHGYKVETASSVEDAKRVLAQFDAQVALIDLHLERTSGSDLITELKQRHPHLSCFLMADSADSDTIMEAIRRGAEDCLHRPTDQIRLLTALTRCFVHQHLQQRHDEAVEALQAAEEKFRDLYENAPDMYVSVSAESTCIKECNLTLATNLGYTKDEIVGRPIFDVYHPDCMPEVEKAFHSFVSTGEVKDAELQLMRKDGSKIDVSLNVSAVRDENGKTLHSSSTWRDITDRKRAERELRCTHDSLEHLVEKRTQELYNEVAERKEAEQRAEEANRAKSQFLSQMSHELRSPLNSVIGFSEILIAEISDKRQLRYVRNIRSAGNHLLNLIGDILDISKIEAGKLELETLDFNLEALLEEVSNLINDRAQEKCIGFAIETTADVPQWLKGDSTRIRQVLLNLADNAIKFTHAGSVRIRVEKLAEQSEAPVLKYLVKDTGIGVAEDKLGKLFEAFTQAESLTTRHYGGTGLGLNICKQLVETMGGEIGVESTVGEGCCFWFCLPLIEGQAPAVSEAQEEQVASRPLSILVAEDMDMNVLVVKAMLEPDGHRVSVAQDGLEALEAVQCQHFDVVLMDIHMPRMDGIEATKCIRALPNPEKAQVPIIVLSADVMKEQQERLIQAGMNASIAKPFQRDELRRALAAAVGTEAIPSIAVEVSQEVPLVDQKHLDEMTDAVGPDALKSILEQFYAGSHMCMLSLKQAGEQGDRDGIWRAAHSLKGMAGNLGLVLLYSTCKQLQQTQTETPMTNLAQLIIEVEKTLLESSKALQKALQFPSMDSVASGYRHLT